MRLITPEKAELASVSQNSCANGVFRAFRIAIKEENWVMIANTKERRREDRFNDSHYQASSLAKTRHKAPATPLPQL